MSTDSKLLNPLRRDGTSQTQRLVKALQPSTAKIDDRDLGALLRYAYGYAQLLRYFTPEDKEAGDWTPFFKQDSSVNAALLADAEGGLAPLIKSITNDPGHAPQMALFLAFLRLFRYQQKHINRITQEHLDFYYREVLRLKPHDGQADKVHVIFELAKQVETGEYLIPKDTVLLAGKDATQVELLYATDRNYVVNSAAVDLEQGLKTVFVEAQSSAKGRVVSNIYAADKANFSDGNGGALTDIDHKWLTLGATTMPGARVGFAIASPMFLLAEGTRGITVELRFTPGTDFLAGESAANVEIELQNNIKVQASSVKQWIDLTTDSVDIDPAAGTLRFTLSLESSSPAIVGYNPKILSENFATTLPVLCFTFLNAGQSAAALSSSAGRAILDYSDRATYAYRSVVSSRRKLYQAKLGVTKSGLRPEEQTNIWQPLKSSYPYKYFDKLEIKGLAIGVKVRGVRSLVIENDFGVVNPAKPFLAFGAVPRIGSRLLVGSSEAFQKRLNSVTMRAEWSGLPKKNFSQHYADYSSKESVPDNQYFTASAELLQGGQWVPGKADSISAPPGRLQLRCDLRIDTAAFGPGGAQIATISRATLDGKRSLAIFDGSVFRSQSVPQLLGERVLLISCESKSGSVVAAMDTGIYRWRTADTKSVETILNARKGVQAIALSKDRSMLALAMAGTGVQIFNLSQSTPQFREEKTQAKEAPSGDRISTLAFNSDGELLLSGSGRTVQLRAVSRKFGSAPRSVALPEPIEIVKFFPSSAWRRSQTESGLFFAVGTSTLSIYCWNPKSGALEPVTPLQDRGLGKGYERSDAILDFDISPDGTRMVSTTKNGSARLWTLKNLRVVEVRSLDLPEEAKKVTCVSFDHSGSRILTGSSNGMVAICDGHSGALLNPLEGHGSAVRIAAFGESGTQILSVDNAGVALLWGGGTTAAIPLFSPPGTELAPKTSRVIVPQFDWATLKRSTEYKPFTAFDNTLQQGFLRLVLKQDFLHDLYAPLLAAAATSGNPPNAPYTPTISSISLDYSAAEEIDYESLHKKDFAERIEQLFQLGPFGHREIFPIADESAVQVVPVCRTLVPDFRVATTQSDTTLTQPAEGTLYIGLAKLAPPQNLSILFQVAEGSEDGTITPPAVVWSHLDGDRWVEFTTSERLYDSTDGLLGSGIIEFAMPGSMTRTNASMPAGLHWIKASVQQGSSGLPKMIAVRAQAVVASFRDQGNDPAHLASALPDNTISKLQDRPAEIKSVVQPYASFEGKASEASQAFYMRTSEHLRHERRAVTIFDYERLVLKEFPEVYKVKCINHTRTTSECAPGYVRVVVIPNLRNQNAVDKFQPRLSSSKKAAITKFLAALASDFVTIQVTDPDYEQVQVKFQVRFQSGREKGYYTKQLNQDIIQVLSPWLYDDSFDLNFGGRIHRSTVLNWIEERDYVDFVTDFHMDHIVASKVFSDVEEAVATRSSSVIVSVPQHIIGGQTSSCEDVPVTPPPAPTPPGPEPTPLPPGLDRYLANTRTREVHDLLNRNPNCQIDEIQSRFFTQLELALRMGYDYCAYCFDRKLSQR